MNTQLFLIQTGTHRLYTSLCIPLPHHPHIHLSFIQLHVHTSLTPNTIQSCLCNCQAKIHSSFNHTFIMIYHTYTIFPHPICL